MFVLNSLLKSGSEHVLSNCNIKRMLLAKSQKTKSRAQTVMFLIKQLTTDLHINVEVPRGETHH